ncbi:nucleotidyl transferase AbiEii/AbiGii toxin family protein [Fastidiosipila sanguinis]|uniref:Nucleotidyl transferase AbiEii/AbiGii toxin family protein n=1 Tax=Fastidiosipila sanguinis TaxID=236753 RepID=A0A2S0KNZ3_9FIRM|nr:nucleotidyl transferase AbiEii/AbiGii toxin family protein [Fastidiosipila sanguinis]AVM42743.1 nucleotidyl transferase AbiEii/AbiGii toxin family protein [Fastidiosipila sanguinis]
MNKFYIENKEDLKVLIVNTARKKNISEVIIEKDYWVTIILDYLFNENKWKEYFTFKGGTSLSKCFGLIERFSEDIDLILDWRVLGYEEKEPWIERSNTKQDKFNKEINVKTEIFLRDKLLKVLEKDLKNLGFEFSIDRIDQQTILCKYPKIFESNYLAQNIRLEIGSLAALTPAIEVEILPIIGEAYPNVFRIKTNIRTVSAERTFWEKATILHHEANRPESSSMPHRYARHFYDLYKITNSDIKNKALEDKDLLKKVIEFKMKFYPRKWAKYEEALNGRLRLVSAEYRFSEIEKDYRAMSEMIYGNYPKFEDIIKTLKQLENEINS